MIFVFSGCKKSNHPLSTYEKTDEERVSLSLVESSVTPEKLTIEITNKIFKGKDLNQVDSHTINYGHIIDNDNIIISISSLLFLNK